MTIREMELGIPSATLHRIIHRDLGFSLLGAKVADRKALWTGAKNSWKHSITCVLMASSTSPQVIMLVVQSGP